MTWWNPFKKTEDQQQPAAPGQKAAGTTTAAPPELPKELADSPLTKGMMAKFYRMWKNPAFLNQLRTLSAHMAKDGVNIKDMSAVKAWLEKNKDAIEAGKFKELPPEAAKQETFVKTGPDVGRNDPCPCGSGKKYKKCCGAKS